MEWFSFLGKKKKLGPVGSCVSIIFQLIQQFHVPLWILLYCIYCLVQTIEIMVRMMMLSTLYCTGHWLEKPVLARSWSGDWKTNAVHWSAVGVTKKYLLTVHYLKIYHKSGFSSCFRRRRLCWTALGSIWIQLCAGEFVASTVFISYQHYLSLFEELIFSCPEAVDCAVQTRTTVQSFRILGGLSSDS